MEILLYNPDNQATINFMPQLWMFRLKPHRPRLDGTNHGRPNSWLTTALLCA
jgi:hypothetical protein